MCAEDVRKRDERVNYLRRSHDSKPVQEGFSFIINQGCPYYNGMHVVGQIQVDAALDFCMFLCTSLINGDISPADIDDHYFLEVRECVRSQAIKKYITGQIEWGKAGQSFGGLGECWKKALSMIKGAC